MAKVIHVIETSITKGKGTPENPYRKVNQYFTLEGQLLAERDSLQTPCGVAWTNCPTCFGLGYLTTLIK